MMMSSPAPPSEPGRPDYDPVFLHSRREAIFIFCVWLAAFAWSVPYCYLTGYGQPYDAATFATVWGIPSWLFWGVLVPWLAADVVTVWFCFCYMQDDDLGQAAEGADWAEENAERHAGDKEAGR